LRDRYEVEVKLSLLWHVLLPFRQTVEQEIFNSKAKHKLPVDVRGSKMSVPTSGQLYYNYKIENMFFVSIKV